MFRVVTISLLVVLFAAGMVIAQDHAYQGLRKCSMCHKGESKGSMKEIWENSKHAKAYASLPEDHADDCLRCHSTGYGVDDALKEKLDINNGVTCEACHGAGDDYGKMSTMRDREASIAAGMVANPMEGCADCHVDDSELFLENHPDYEGFDVEAAWEQIKHTIPE